MDLQDFKENPIRYIKGFAMDLIVALVGVSYVLYQMVTLEKTDVDPLVLLAQATIGIICGVVIKQSLGENGFSKGYNSDYWIREEDKYNSACDTAIPYMEKVDNFYIAEEIEKKRNYRREHLQAVRLKYDQWFDFEGNFIGKVEDYKKLTIRQKLMVRKCVRVKIYIPNLFSEYSTASEQYTHREMTDKKQRGKNITKNTISATIIAIIGVYFIPLFKWNIASLISATIQVALWITFGVLQLYQNYSFIINDKTALLRIKKQEISKFVSGCEKHLYDENPYDKIVDNEHSLVA